MKRGSRSAKPGAGWFPAVCGALVASAGAYVALHLARPLPGEAPGFWVQTLPGRIVECGAWLAFGGLLSVLEALTRRRTPGLGRAVGLLAGGLVLAALRLALEALHRWVPGQGWLALDLQALAAGTAIPLAFALGVEAKTMAAWTGRGLSAKPWERLRACGAHFLSAMFRRV